MSENKLRHVAIIMDGNGRWATMRSRPRVWGHIRGSSVVADIVEEADACGVQALTLYAFSTENWCRPQTEVRVLFALLKKFLLKERPRLLKNQVRFRMMGDLSHLPKDTQNLINSLENETKDFKGLKLTFAFSYGGRAEIVSAVNNWVEKNPGQKLTIESLQESLLVPDLGDVDLLIRTGGDQRISNFMLWQVAYAELYFTHTKWPDFTALEFRSILENTGKRERRFGSVSAEENLNQTVQKAHQNKFQLFNQSEVH